MLCLTAMTDMFMDITKFYITDTATQCGNDLLTLISVSVIKAYFIKASIRNNTQ